ncbi:GGDEF domain-containing protein [Novosphingobium olei]|nr:GGDEF domain-containing protein [Novosphingobium olei]
MAFYQDAMASKSKRDERGWRRIIACTIVLLCALLTMPLPAQAATVPVEQICHANAALGEDFAAFAESRWICTDDHYSIASDVIFVRFRLKPDQAAPRPAGFVSHAVTFERIDLWVVDADGSRRALRYTAAETHHMGVGPMIAAALPPVGPDSRFVVARIVGPWSKTLASDARLDTLPAGTGWSLGEIVAVAAICGMLAVPLLMAGGYWVVLRQPYVVWHALLIFSMLVQALMGTGFFHILGELPIFVEGAISCVCYSVMGASALMFSATFVEPGMLGPRVGLAIRLGALLTLGCGLVAALPLDALRPYSTMQLYLGMGLSILLIMASMIEAWRRGSSLVWYQIVGWTPALLVAVYRIARYVSPDAQPTNSVAAQQLALAVEVLVSSLGILSRLLDLRLQRDRATALALEMEGVAGRDALTGLWNRRSIEKRFADLFASGFRTMAVLDLDHFKAVNDLHGHAMGDAVLKAAATALSGDGDTRAVRLGGEEFMLLLRGSDSAERAERRRRAISARVAAELPGLDRVVTASMGLVEHDPRGNLSADFDALYAHCDRLLYEAKRLGRNRTMRERMIAFVPPAPMAAAAAG